MNTLIQAENLVKSFGSKRAVDGISLKADKGEVLGFLGPNGAGKTTTMRMLTGYLEPTSGTIAICGIKLENDPIALKERIGYLPEGAPLYSDMTPAQILKFAGEVRRMKGARLRERFAYVTEALHLNSVLAQPVETLSKGFKRRVGLALALLHDPEVLILDEPTDGLDPLQKHEVRELIRRMAKDKAIVISTHILEEVEAVCTRALIIAQGKLVADGTPAQLTAKSKKGSLDALFREVAASGAEVAV